MSTLVDRLTAQLGDAAVRVIDAVPDLPVASAGVPRAIVLVGAAARDAQRACAEHGFAERWRGTVAGEHVAVLGVADDEQLAELLAAGPHSLLLDPAVDVSAAKPERLHGLRVAVLTYEYVGVTNNGGIGTAYTGLAEALAGAGADVQVLATGFHGYWTEAERAARATGTASRSDHERLHVHRLDPDGSRHVLSPYWDVRRAHAAYAWLRDEHRRRPFDVIHVPESRGHGAYVISAKRAGLAFDGATIVVGVHSPMLWQHEGNLLPFDSLDAIIADYLERVSLRDADVLVAPSAYMYDYLDARGYETRAPRFVQQNLAPHSKAPGRVSAPGEAATTGPRELVFFGRLETRKGLDAFLDAIDLLASSADRRDLTITFLGRAGVEDEPPEDVIRRRARSWPWPVAIHSHFDQPEALAYLRSRRCVLAMPSRVENSPMTVLEALELGAPFVASGAGGTGELVHPDDRDAVIVPWHDPTRLAPASFDEPQVVPPAGELARALEMALGGRRAARHAVAPAVNRDAQLRWHAALAARERAPAPEAHDAAEVEIEVVSVPAEGEALIDAVLEAKATHVLLRLPHHELVDDALGRLAEAVRRTDARVVTFAVALGEEEEVEVPAGGPAVAGVVHDVFSAGSALIQRELLLRPGVLPADAPGSVAVHAALAALAIDGHEPLVLPEPLAVERGRRDPPGALRRASSLSDALMFEPDQRRLRFVLRPYRAAMAPELRELPPLLRAAVARTGEERSERIRAEERVMELDGCLKDTSARVAELDAQLADALARVRELDDLRKDAEAAVLERDRDLAKWRSDAARHGSDTDAALRTAQRRWRELRRRRAVRVALALSRPLTALRRRRARRG